MKNATPAKLRNGDWGAWVESEVSPGDPIKVTSRKGDEWVRMVTKVVFQSPEGRCLVKLAPYVATRRGPVKPVTKHFSGLAAQSGDPALARPTMGTPCGDRSDKPTWTKDW